LVLAVTAGCVHVAVTLVYVLPVAEYPDQLSEVLAAAARAPCGVISGAGEDPAGSMRGARPAADAAPAAEAGPGTSAYSVRVAARAIAMIVMRGIVLTRRFYLFGL
jgi:hypothetical protein